MGRWLQPWMALARGVGTFQKNASHIMQSSSCYNHSETPWRPKGRDNRMCLPSALSSNGIAIVEV